MSLQPEIAGPAQPEQMCREPFIAHGWGKQKARGDLSRGPVNFSDDASMQVFCPTSQICSKSDGRSSPGANGVCNLHRRK
jgi:hypothetical protein